MMCTRCEELEERVAWLESELGIQVDITAIERLRRYFLAQARQQGRSRAGAARFVMALYGLKGRAATRLQLLDATARDEADEGRAPKIIDVWVCIARRVLGHEAIETVWGSGYRLTAEGQARVAEIIGDVQPARAA